MPRALRALVPALALVAAGVMAYANSFTGVFLFDDRRRNHFFVAIFGAEL